MANLLQFLANLATNPELQEQYREDPDSVMKMSGLDAEQIALIKGNDKNAIHSYLGQGVNAMAWDQPNEFQITEFKGVIKTQGGEQKVEDLSGSGKMMARNEGEE